MIERSPKEVPVVEHVTMTILRALLAEQRQEMRQLIRENGIEPTMPIEKPDLNMKQSKEGNYSMTISQAEPQVVRRDNPERKNEGNDGCKCKYKDFMGAKPPNLSGIPKPVESWTESLRWRWYLRAATAATSRKPFLQSGN